MDKQRYEGLKWFHVIVLLAVSGLFFLAEPRLTIAQDFPTRPIIFNVPSTAGSIYALIPQAVGDVAKKYLKNPQPFMVNYKPGGAGMIGADYVLKQPADGHNIFVLTLDVLAKFAEDPKGNSFTKDDFIPIATLGISPQMVAVLKTRPWNTIEELIDYAKKNPGKLSYGSVGVGSSTHLSGALIEEACGIKLNHIPFTGATVALPAILGGHVDISLFSIGTTREHIKTGGALKVLAVMDNERYAPVKDVPTFLERGYDVQSATGMTIAVVKGTPQPIVDQLRDVFKKALDDPAGREAIVKLGSKPFSYGTEQTRQFIEKYYTMWRAAHQRVGTAK